ncbi:MAG TPA: C25 family cysteine peptidase, partial [Planctomycetota bacterium]|nr:C25 family cysteine peptidase [Planctomycetota bacterium]
MGLLFLLLAAQAEDPEYLILAHDALADAVRPLADWKRQKGYRTAVVRLSDVAESPTPEALRAFIRKSRPRYVLLVGDAPLLPPHSVKRNRRIPTDLYYGCLDDGDDWHPDAYVGRLPAGTPEECAVMVRKILTYERTPDGPSCRRALVAAEFADHDNDGYENEKFLEAAVAARTYLEAVGVSARTAFQRKPASTALPLRHARAHTGEWDLRWAGGDVIKGTWGPTLHPEGLPYVVAPELLPDEAAFRKRMSEALQEGVGLVQFNLHGKPKETVFPRHGVDDVKALT